MKLKEAFKRFIFPLFIFGCIFYIIIESHEDTHEQIIKYYGCSIEERGFMHVRDNCNNITIEEYISYNHAQSLNEIVGYNIMPILFLIIVFLFLLLIKE